MMKGTEIVVPPASVKTPADATVRTGYISVDTRVIMNVATDLVNKGERVVLVSAACGYQMSGGFTTGGRHALEESLNVQSTLFPSLRKAASLGFGYDLTISSTTHTSYIPEAGVVLSPFVELFRKDVTTGYEFRKEGPVVLDAVVSVAMPNLNPRVGIFDVV